jgi:hypothetical protein
VLNWQRFCGRPHQHFEIMLKKLQQPGDASVFENVRAEHYFGGNDSIGPVLQAGRVSFRPPRAGTLSLEDRTIVERHNAAQSVYRMLETCYRSDFRDLDKRIADAE